MKTAKRLTAVLLAVIMTALLLPLSGAAWGSEDNRIAITHINTTASTEGSGILMTPSAATKVGQLGTFAWWSVVVFDWDATDSCYKVLEVYANANNSDKSAVAIPKTGFAYGVCVGNNYPALGQTDKPNYISKRIQDSNTLARSLKKGDKVYLYNTDLLNGIIDTYGSKWYDETEFTTKSYIKVGEPDADGTPYNPDNPDQSKMAYTLLFTECDTKAYSSGACNIYTPAFESSYVKAASGDFSWWQEIIFEWDEKAGNFVVASVNKAQSNNYPKQSIIPENGFAVADCYSGSASAITNISVGDPAWLYGVDLKNGTMTSGAKVTINEPDKALTAVNPGVTNRLAVPSFTNISSDDYTLCGTSDFTVSWSPVAGAESYVVAVNSTSASVTDGVLAVIPTDIGNNCSYTISSDKLEIGNRYLISVYAKSAGKASSRLARGYIVCVSDAGANSALKDKTIVAFGDSLTARTGYVDMLYGFLGSNVINSGVGGNNTQHARARFDVDVLDKNPDIVLINFGMNDAATVLNSGNPTISKKIYTDNLTYFAKTLTEAGVDVVFVTPNPVNTNKGYYVAGNYGLDYGGIYLPLFAQAMRQVASDYGCGLVDIYTECINNEDLDKFINAGDGIHQSTYGHTRYAELISDYLLAKYDGTGKVTVTAALKDTNGKDLGTQTFVGIKGADILLTPKTITGYVCEPLEYTFIADDEIEIVYDLKVKSLELVDGSTLALDVENKCVLNVKPGTIASVIASSFQGSVTVTDKNGKAITGVAKVGTGCKVKLEDLSYDIVILGDINGDGSIAATDYLMAKRIFLGTYDATPAQIKAGCIEGGSEMKAADYMKLKRHVLGSFDIFKK